MAQHDADAEVLADRSSEEVDPEQRTTALAAVRTALEHVVDDEEVRSGAATWLLTGRRPG